MKFKEIESILKDDGIIEFDITVWADECGVHYLKNCNPEPSKECLEKINSLIPAIFKVEHIPKDRREW